MLREALSAHSTTGVNTESNHALQQASSFHLQEDSSPRNNPDADSTDNAQSLHLLSTKLTIPVSRIRLLPRPGLVKQLNMAIAQEQKLILVAAPAGFGKTTAVAEWLRGIGNRGVAWFALDTTDNQLNRFLAYIIATLETVRPTIGTAAWSLLRAQAEHPPTKLILTALLNALADSTDQLMLVLDDYHTITLQPIHEALTFLLDHMPPHLHVIITTRSDPPLPLARLRARGQLAEIRAAHLRFTHDEAAALFAQVHGIPLSPDAVITLEARTEGWAAGLQLAALSLQQQDATQIPTFLANFSGSHVYVFDYLADEVFRQQPEHVRSFLQQTAILGRMCGPLCAAVTGQDDAQALLEHLGQVNLFLTPLDNNRNWYRYHHLFRDFLCDQLGRIVLPAERAMLYARASTWFEQQGMLGDAIGYALSGQLWDTALRCMTLLMGSQRFYEYYLDWPRWVAALPDAALAVEPDLCRRLAWILIFTGHLEAAERPLSLAEAVWRSAGNQIKLGELFGIRAIAWGWKGNFPNAIQAAQQSLALLPADAVDRHGVPSYVLGQCDLQLGHIGSATDWLIAASVVTQAESIITQTPTEIFLSLATAASLARAYQLRGDLQHAATLYFDVIRRMGNMPYLQVPSALISLGSLCYERNDLAEAERWLRAGIAVAERVGRARYWSSAWSILAWTLLATGDVLQAQAMADHALVLAQALDNAPEIIDAQVLQGQLWLAQGDLTAALRWLNTRTLALDHPLLYPQQTEYLMLARIRITQARQAPEAADLHAIVRQLELLLQLANTDQRMADRITILALLALAHTVEGDSTQALQCLAAAIQLAAPEGYIRRFVDEGPPMRLLLAALREQVSAMLPEAEHMAYFTRLLEAFPADLPSSSGAVSTSTLLSKREQMVLQCIVEGRSIQDIAAILVISAHTARTHVKNIYTKLNAHNRVQAIKHARALQLI